MKTIQPLANPMLGREAPGSRSGVFALALALAILLHALFILGITPNHSEPSRPVARELEVLILQDIRESPATTDFEALAQANQPGEGGRGESATPMVPESPPPDKEEDGKRAPRPLGTELDLRPAHKEVDIARILASRGAEIARLSDRVQERSAAYANRTRRKAISTSTRELKYASYMEAWRRKVEKIGNLNYPEEAKVRDLHGNLILHVAVRFDGQVEAIRVLRSSGHSTLDEAAVRIVELAAPFAPFPPDIRAETDILDITRTWQFLHGNRLGWND